MQRLAGIAVLSIAVVSLPACRPPAPAGETTEAATPGLGATPPSAAPVVQLPARSGSVRFAVIGDAGRGDRPQHEVAARMTEAHARFPFEFVLMVGDNIYEGSTAADYAKKFEQPYAPLLASGVRFFASLGNHDDPNQRFYEPFNMEGRRYYTFRPPAGALRAMTGSDVRFFALDSNYLDSAQLEWLDRELKQSDSRWKICFQHHPLYSSGRYARDGGALRRALEPLFTRHRVAAVFAGHEHFYERLHPQHGIQHFITGAAGSLRRGDLRQTTLTAAGFDEDYSFMLVEIADREMFFQAISRTGMTVDYGSITIDE
jgi:hypothetical protein